MEGDGGVVRTMLDLRDEGRGRGGGEVSGDRRQLCRLLAFTHLQAAAITESARRSDTGGVQRRRGRACRLSDFDVPVVV